MLLGNGFQRCCFLSFHVQRNLSLAGTYQLQLMNWTNSSQNQSYDKIDDNSASLSWFQIPIWSPRADFRYCQTFEGLLMWGVFSDVRTGMFYNCCWPSPARSSSCPSPAGLAMFYCLSFDTPLTWRTRSLYVYPLEIGWPPFTPRHWVPFSSPFKTRRVTLKVFEPASTWAPLAHNSRLTPYVS
jgi:hypothetical protein